MKKKNNGFTLVELMAVIVILAVIVLIAFNRIKNVLKKNNEDTIVANANVFVKAVNESASTSRITENFEDGEYEIQDLYDMGLSLSGTKPDNGYIIISDGNVSSGCLKYDSGYASISDGVVSYSKEECNIDVTDEDLNKVFAYTGKEETFKVKKTGIYKLEVWGAQGGSVSTTYIGGYGGFSSGNIQLNRGTVLSINVGGAGTASKTEIISGGYNGGGSAKGGDCSTYTNRWGASGGGATSIIKESGELRSINNKNNILIVAAGGGGSFNIDNYQFASGGHAGGIIGNSGTHNRGNFAQYASGGTQSSGGHGGDSYTDISTRSEFWINLTSGKFGEGGSSGTYECGEGGGGGSGYYGGGGSDKSSGAGGSGYIGNTNLTDKTMYCYNCTESTDTNTKTISTTCVNENPTENCAKLGNGYAKITFIE
jgi:prepilin-type N-terminal cleavage/methylation domain-containing protein